MFQRQVKGRTTAGAVQHGNSTRLLIIFVVGIAAVFPLHAQKHLPFGFSGLEIFKLGDRTSRIRSAELNGDTLTDCLLLDNSKGSVCYLLQRAEKEQVPASDLEVNEIPSDLRFKRQDNLTEKKIYDMALGDFNSDGTQDIAFWGEPEGLELQWGGSPWNKDKRLFTVQRPVKTSYSLLAGDVSGDGRADLLALTERGFQVYLQKDSLKAGQLIPLPGDKINYAALHDVNGNGRLDLLTVAPGTRQVRVRFADENGFGPEWSFRIAQLSFLKCADVCPSKGDELVAVQSNPLRISIFRLAEEKQTQPLGQVAAYSLSGGSGVKAFVPADINGDGNLDLCYALSDGADIGVRFGSGDGSFGTMNRWPTLSSVVSLSFVDSDGKKSLVVLSKEEKSMGVMTWDGERLTFPSIIGLPGTPVSCTEIIAPGGGEKLALALSRGASDYVLWIGEITGGAFEKELEGTFSKRIKGIRTGDFNGDGVDELLVFRAYEAPQFLIWDDENKGQLKRLDVVESRTKSFFENIEPGSVSTGRLGSAEGEQLLLVQKNFIRVLRLDAAGRLQVLDQYQALGGSSLANAFVVDLENDGKKEILAYDGTSKKVVVFTRQPDGLMTPSAYQEIPGAGRARFYAGDCNGDKRPEIIFPRGNDIAVLIRGNETLELQSVLSYEIEKGRQKSSSSVSRYSRSGSDGGKRVIALAAGDLNGDGGNDICFVTSEDLRMRILEVRDDMLKKAMEFPILEKKAGGEGGNAAIRDLEIADVTGDGLNDILMLIHDRMLLYPQDSVAEQKKGAGK